MESVKEKKIKIARTRKGIPCLWESIMEFPDLKRATVIFNNIKEVKNAIFLNSNREKQALVPIQEGDYISKVYSDKNGIALSIFQIVEISSMENVASIIPVFRKSSLIQEYVVDKNYEMMVNITEEKLLTKNVYSKFVQR